MLLSLELCGALNMFCSSSSSSKSRQRPVAKSAAGYESDDVNQKAAGYESDDVSQKAAK
jgi:hypothetical protein